ncbi:4'-phosphopantetheinyl transferase family protein [Bacillus toyonensis]|uniref:4'-phosphopantetheinyl transferase family protein n=1 Tax=Bacillus toyonensis TaxID=155322 RepID=UPI000BF534D4|nr:4'-phosphopantetheinyl transferase superfamily protein [Bacillus toyonensis]PGD12321.1 4-phosphopantetheinyl transferase [Bacillus toyonensis]
MSTIYAIKIPKFYDESTYNSLLNLVSVEKKKKIEGFKKKEDSYRTLLGDVLVRSIICKRYKIYNQNIKYDYNKYGKPTWKGDIEFFFNISHSGNWIVCIVDNAPVGIDIEQIRPIKLKDISKVFSEKEIEDLNLKTLADKYNYFYDLWTLKESYIKAIGTGFGTPFNSFTIRKIEGEDITLIHDNIKNTYGFKQYNIDPNYKLSVCATSKKFSNEVILKNIYGIFQDITMNNQGV